MGIRGDAAGAGGGSAARLPFGVAMLLAAGFALSACGSSEVGGPRASGGGGGWARAGHPTYKVGAPYQINGVWYYPKVDYDYDETGVASWYGEAFDKQSTANGEIFDLNELTAAHRTLPLPSVVEVTNLQNGRTMQVRVNDRGPFAQNRILDVSRRAAQLLGFERSGTTPVHVRIVKDESIRVAQAAMRGSTGEVRLAANLSAGAAASEPARPASRRPAERPVAVAELASPRQPATYRLTEETEIIASQPRPNPPEPERNPPAIAPEIIASQPRPNPPPHRAPWYSPIASAEAETLPPPLRRADPDRIAVSASSSAAKASRRDGRIFVQVGAFSVPENAQRARTRIASFANVEVLPTSGRGSALYLVRVGPVGSATEADRLVTRLVENGYPDARIVNQ